MSTYVREKVLRIPFEKMGLNPDEYDDVGMELEEQFAGLFDYGEVGKFQFAPTDTWYIDYVLDYEWDADGEYGKTRALTEREKAAFDSVFRNIYPDVNMDDVRLVEFCWYNGTEAPDYYDEENDSFYDEIC